MAVLFIGMQTPWGRSETGGKLSSLIMSGCAGLNRHVGVSSEGWRIQWEASPTRVKVRTPVAWIVERKETESRKLVAHTRSIVGTADCLVGY